MRVGILTFSNTINYGALLQAYALQEIIRNHGFEAEILQYINTEIEKKEKNQGISLRKVVKKIVMKGAINQKVKAFQEFEDQYIIKGKVISDDSKELVNDYYDYFITGSDQVWNMKITHNDWTYFLDFVRDDRKKISYAPSFGNNPFPDEDKKQVAQYLKCFESLSVREVSGQTLIKNISGLNAKVVIDPTLLLTKDMWLSRTTFKPSVDKYILVYFPHNKSKVFEFVDKLREKTALPVIYLSISPRKQSRVTTIFDASPGEFLGWIANASYVVTGSFHGTAFSINFEKQFFYESSGSGSRIDNIVRLCGLEERSISNLNSLQEDIDYGIVREKIAAERDSSLEWLTQALEKRYEKD